MKRRSRTTALSVAAVSLLAAPLLSGCATDAHPGAAAVVGGERITVAELQSEVERVRDAQLALPDGEELVVNSRSLNRQMVDFLVYLEVLDEASAEHGVDVSRREVQQARREAERFMGGAENLRNAALVPRAGMPLAGEHLDLVFRSNLQYQGLARALGVPVSPDGQLTEEGHATVGKALADTARDIGVEVNPRYGEWDADTVSLAEAELPWLRVQDPHTIA